VTSGVEVNTSNGHTVRLDLEDWDRLRPLLAAGVRLQSLRTRDTVVVILREYDPPRTVSLIKALAGPYALFKSSDMLDHRRGNIEAPGRPQTG
jgi:hypothetical protein